MTNDYLYVFDKNNKTRTVLGEIQTNFNMSFVIDGTKDSAKVIIWSYISKEIEPYTIAWHKNTDTWWVVSSDKVERYLNENNNFVYTHSLELIGAIELLNARDLIDCGFNDNTYTVAQFLRRLLSLSNLEIYCENFNAPINFLNKKVDFIKTFENYTLLSALREFLDAYNMCPKLTFDTYTSDNVTYLDEGHITIIPKTGDYSLTTHDSDYFQDVKEIKTINKDSFGTCVVSNAENVISSKHKTYPTAGSVKLSSSQYLIVDGVNLNDALIRLPSKVYKGNWLKIIYPLEVRLTVSGTVIYHTFDYIYQRTTTSFEKMVSYFKQKIIDETARPAIANMFEEYANDSIKNILDLASVVTLYDGNNINAYTGEIIKGKNVPRLAEMYFVGTKKNVIFTDKNTKECLKDKKQGIAWERGSNLITGFDMFDGADRLQVLLGSSDYSGPARIIEFTYEEITVTLDIEYQQTLKDVYTGSPSLANQLSKLSFIVDYIPMMDLKIKLDNQRDKKDIQLYNQNGRLTDSVALSKLLNSYSKEISSDTITKYRQDYSYNACPKVGSIVYINGEHYVINNVSLDITINEEIIEKGYFIDGEYTMSKYVSTKSIMINPNTNIRDYGIPQNFNVKRKQLYRDYYELAYQTFSDANADDPYYDWQKVLNISKKTYETSDFIAVIQLKYENEIGEPLSNTWHYQLDTTVFYLDKMFYAILDFNDNNIIGYGSQNVYSGFDVSRIFDGSTDRLNTPISYVDENGKFVGVDIVLCDKDQITEIYDEYQEDSGGSSYGGVLYNYSVFIPQEIYEGALDSHEIRITEETYNKDALEVPVFEYACQIGDSESVIIGDNILTQYTNCIYLYTYVVGDNLTTNNVSPLETAVETIDGWEIDNACEFSCSVENSNKLLKVDLYSSMNYVIDTDTWSYGNLINPTPNKDIAIFRYAVNPNTGEIIAQDLILIAKKVPISNIESNEITLYVNHYKLK